MRDVDLKSADRVEGFHRSDHRLVIGSQFRLGPTSPAIQVTVLSHRQDVEFLATVGAVAVAEHAQILKDTQRAIDRGRDRPWVQVPTAVHELSPGHMAIGSGQDIDEDPSLRCPAQTAGTKAIWHAGPCPRWGRVVGMSGRRSGRAHRPKV